MKCLLAVLSLSLFLALPAKAQMSATRDAQYMATLKAVANYKIDDEENIRDVERLREDRRFNQKLARMLDKLQNDRTKNSTNKRVYNILLKAGKDVYNELN